MGAHLAASTPSTMTEALTLNDFASQLSAADAQPGQADDAPETDSQESQQVEDDTPEGVDAEGEQSPDAEAPEEADSEDGQAEKAPDEEMVIKWKTASGEAYEAPLKELKDGYMRREHFTQETQKLSQERERAQTAVMEQFNKVQALGPELGRLQQVSEQIAQYQRLDWNSLKAQDPAMHDRLITEFLVLREQGKELQQSVQLKAGHIEQLKQQEAVAAQQAAAEHLKSKVKDFGDKQLAAMNEHMLKKGLKTEDLQQVAARLGKTLAPAVLEAIHEAAQWRALQDKKPQIDNRVRAIPPKPAARAQQSKPTSQQEQLAKVAASGKPMSAANFASLLAQTRRK